MSLADELLADLEEAGDEGEDGLYAEGDEGEMDGDAIQGRTDGGLEDIPEEMEVDYSKAESVTSIAKLRNSKQRDKNGRRESVSLRTSQPESLLKAGSRCLFFTRHLPRSYKAKRNIS